MTIAPEVSCKKFSCLLLKTTGWHNKYDTIRYHFCIFQCPICNSSNSFAIQFSGIVFLKPWILNLIFVRPFYIHSHSGILPFIENYCIANKDSLKGLLAEFVTIKIELIHSSDSSLMSLINVMPKAFDIPLPPLMQGSQHFCNTVEHHVWLESLNIIIWLKTCTKILHEISLIIKFPHFIFLIREMMKKGDLQLHNLTIDASGVCWTASHKWSYGKRPLLDFYWFTVGVLCRMSWP